MAFASQRRPARSTPRELGCRDQPGSAAEPNRALFFVIGEAVAEPFAYLSVRIGVERGSRGGGRPDLHTEVSGRLRTAGSGKRDRKRVGLDGHVAIARGRRSEEHTSELKSLMRI